jgi:hypothetical protein
MECAIWVKVRRLVHEPVLTSLVAVHDRYIPFYLIRARVQEKSAAALGSQVTKGLLSRRFSPQVPLVSKNIDSCTGTLTHIDHIVKTGVASIIDAIGKEQYEIARGYNSIRCPSVPACPVKRIEDGST